MFVNWVWERKAIRLELMGGWENSVGFEFGFDKILA